MSANKLKALRGPKVFVVRNSDNEHAFSSPHKVITQVHSHYVHLHLYLVVVIVISLKLYLTVHFLQRKAALLFSCQNDVEVGGMAIF